MTTVTLEEAKQRLKITTNDDNDHLGQLLEEAEDYIARFIGGPLEVEGQVPAGIRGAVLAYVAHLYDGTPVDLGGLLAPYREWPF